jgi:hypothetical protein
MPDQIHQIGGILAIMDRERRLESNLASIIAQEPRTDAVERSGPGECVRHDAGAIPHRLAGDSLDAPSQWRRALRTSSRGYGVDRLH